MNYLQICLIAYLFGSFPTALIIVNLFTKKDVRSDESGNMGAMNTLRMVKKTKGLVPASIAFIIVWLTDCAKAIFAIIITQHLIPNSNLAITLASFFVVLGHNYPIWLKGKGGRGASSLMGIMMYLNFPVFIYWLIAVFLGSVITELVIRIIKKQSFVFKTIFKAISDQIAGRLIGEIIAVLVVYFVDRQLFFPVLFATILIIYRHKERLIKQLAKK
ncbi:MAG: glycerol-3-phosphate acyltransferase [Candidatus Shapirobacteria bacterium]|nr:glycerol-3-phosphate acyltransferase [Candidatus Shapirobacteria bacterium]